MRRQFKLIVSEIIARYALPLEHNKCNPLDRLCSDVCSFHFNKISQDQLLASLQEYYSKLDNLTLRNELNFQQIKKYLRNSNEYKYVINDIKTSRFFSKFKIRNRRLAIMQNLGMKIDVIVLRENDYIPPHGHKRMVSGFFVLEGKIGVRHYDLVKKTNESLVIKKTEDSIYLDNEFTSNSDETDNIHWLKGISKESYLYRVSIIDKQKEDGKENMGAEERIYINPTIPPDENGLIHAPYINEDLAKNLTFSTMQTSI